MNIMRKILSQGSTTSQDGADGEYDEAAGGATGGGGSASSSQPSTPRPQQTSAPATSQLQSSPAPSSSSALKQPQDLLGLSHLRKLFAEYRCPPHPLGESEKEERLRAMLPLFCKVFAPCAAGTATERLPELAQLAQATARMLVAQVRKRAGNQSTEEAAGAIADYMEVEGEGKEGGKGKGGWMILSAINLMCGEGDAMVDIMTTTSVPSTLVKCLYLFFDLPPLEGSEDGGGGKEEKSDSEFTNKEKRILLQKLFIQILLRLCSHVPAVEELARKDDLTLLFSAVTSICPKHNLMWRKTAADVLLTISRSSLSQPVVSYLHNKGCIALCVENMQRSTELTPLEVVEMFVTVFCFLKDSAQDSQTLLDDFRTCQGYVFLTEFLLKLEQKLGGENESNEAIRNLVLLVASLSFCGHTELKVNNSSVSTALYQLEAFKMPEPENRGSTVRNLQAFQVLQAVFLKAQSEQLTTIVLDAISTIYTADNANYFLLESQHTLPQFAERIGLKPETAQRKFYHLIEFTVQHLKYVPCKEFIAVSLFLKSHENQECLVPPLECLINIIRFDAVFKDAFREIGMVEVLVDLMKAYSDHLSSEKDTKPHMADLGRALNTCLGELLAGSNANGTVFRESGGAKVILSLVKSEKSRESALALTQQLILASGGEEEMTALLEQLHSTPKTNVELKTEILRTLTICLKESHRARAVFRRVGGFVYVISVLVSLENSLARPDDLSDQWKPVDTTSVYLLLQAVFTCLAVSMRFEPANAKFFQVEMNCGSSMAETLKLLGCFSDEKDLPASATKKTKEEHDALLKEVLQVERAADYAGFVSRMPKELLSCMVVLRMLHDMAIDNLGRNLLPSSSSSHSIAPPASKAGERQQKGEAGSKGDIKEGGEEAEEDGKAKAKRVSSLNLTPTPPYPAVVHAGMVTTILKLLPSLYHSPHHDLSVAAQLFTAESVKALLRTDRNQQIMCDVGLVSDLLSLKFRPVLEDETHILHVTCHYLLERLSAQKLEPADLRAFFRLGKPLACLSDEERLKSIDDDSKKEEDGGVSANNNTRSGFIPLTRIKTLVSMTTPRDVHIQTNTIMPPFVEFDMSSPEGFGCLFLASLSPCSPHTATSVVGNVTSQASQEGNVIGGIGQGDRTFPPQSGLTYTTWICVDKFSDPRTDPHPVRLLTLTRQLRNGAAGTQDDQDSFVCFSLSLSARDKAVILSTQETPRSIQSDFQPDFSGEQGSRIWCPDLIKEGEWHHLVVVLNRQALKNPSYSLYVNGQHISTKKMQYINLSPGGGVSNIAVPSTVQAFVGTPPFWRRHSRLCWKQGPCLMFEEVASPALATLLFRLGPHYLGSLQAPQISTTGEVLTSQVAEEKISFGLNAVAVSPLTLAKIRKVYSKLDNKAIARLLSMPSNENATPIRVLHNSAGHLLGPARSLGGVIVGYLGVRVVTPQPVSKVIETVGGCDVLLGIVAMARDMESLYAGVKALVCVLKSNPLSRFEMEKNRGYQTLAMLLRKKLAMLNSHVLYLMFTMAGTIDPGREASDGIPNSSAFRDVLCDLYLWCNAPDGLDKPLFEHFYELLADTNMQRNGLNIRTLREFSLVEKLLSVLKSSSCSHGSVPTLLNVIHALLCANPRVTDVLCFALFTAATLGHNTVSEKHVRLSKDGTEYLDPDQGGDELGDYIVLRNRCLKLFFSLLYTGKRIHTKYCEDVVQVVGFDWILLFVQGHLHPTTAVWGLRILMTLISIPALMDKFRTGTCNGHWLIKSEIVLQNKMVQALGQTSTTTSKATRRGIRQDIFSVPGFQMLNWMMPHHIEVPETYFLMMAIVLGQPVKAPPEPGAEDTDVVTKFDMDAVWNYVFGSPISAQTTTEISGKVKLSGDAMITILCMVRTMLNYESKTPDKLPDWLREYPVTLTQFIVYLYHNAGDFMPVFMTEEVLTALVGTLFPSVTSSSSTPSPIDSNKSSPVKTSATAPEDKVDPEPSKQQQSDSECDALSSHPARRNIINFMRVMVVDSLSLPPPKEKSAPTIDLLLNAQPDNTTHAQQCRFQTELLGVVMDHLVAADVLIGDQAALPIVAGGNLQNIAPNVFYLASRLVDKLWQGVFKKDADEIFQFVLKLIAQAKRRSGVTGGLTLEGIYRCLNRTILYLLSRPHPTVGVASQVTTLEVLHKVTTNRSIVFGAGNHELEFFGCLTFCLLQISEGLEIPTDGKTNTQWHAKPTAATDEDEVSDLEVGESANVHQGQNLLRNAASRVWEEMFVCKRPALEEIFKTSFTTANATPPLSKVRGQVLEPATKTWNTYLDMEKRAAFSKPPTEFHTQLESRIQRITGGFAGGLKRLTSVTGVDRSSSTKAKKAEEPPARVEYSSVPRAVIEQATLNHVGVVREVVDQHYKNRAQTDSHLLKYTEEEWLQTEARLTQERGLWGPYCESSLTKWMLDLTEGPSRMRKRLVRNDLFYLHYPYREDLERESEEKPHKYRRPTSADSSRWFKQHRSLAMFEREEEERLIVEMEYDDCDVAVRDKDIDEQIRSIGFQGLKHAIGQATVVNKKGGGEEDEDDPKEEDEVGEEATPEEHPTTPITPTSPQATSSGNSNAGTECPTSPTGEGAKEQQQRRLPGQQQQQRHQEPHVPIEEESSDYQTVMRLLEEGEKITHMYRCARIQGLDTAEGLMLFGREHFYILDGFTLVNGREVHDIDYIPANRFDPIIPVVPGQQARQLVKGARRAVSKFPYDKIKEVHKRRYLLQPIAIEIFSTDGQNHLLAFSKHVRPKVNQRLLTAAPSILDNASASVAGQSRSANVEPQGSGLLSSLMGETSVTQRWVRGEINNFQYLMALNTLAGRSYNDLMQYPVFPWILADYRSEELDLTDPKTFRDLSRPMGAQTPSRLEQFKRRFEDWDDPQGDTPPYHYGTHYSSAMIVSSYLVRLEPFTQHFLHLQGGHFDLADRMFHSVQEAWDSSSKNNMADLRELIPEFFYLPDFLQNGNRFEMGVKQNGESLSDVVLPPWAKGSPEEFIRVHREALESDYVSAHLHEWIDLIFGHKQQGPGAVDAVNVFHHLFYEGNVDIFSIEDPLQRNATIGFINNFGQIPKQLFKKPHPAKKVGAGAGGVAGGAGSASNGGAAASSMEAGNMNSKVFFHHLTNLRPSMAPVKELKGPVGQIQCSDNRVVYAVEQNKILVPGNSNRYLAWGYADQSFRLGNYESDKAVFICEPNYLIGEVLTCVCPNAKVVLTAGTSTVVAVYEYHKKVKQLLIKKMLYGHTDAVTCLAASPAWNVAVSGSRDRSAIIWDLSRYRYVKHLPGHAGPVAAVAINELTGDIVTAAGSWLYLWDVNGRPISSVDTASANSPAPQQILCVCCSQHQEWDRENVVMTGSADGVVRMWSLDYVEVPEGQQEASAVGKAAAATKAEESPSKDAISSLAKKMSLSTSGDCLSSIREALQAQSKASKENEEQSEPSSDTEGEDLETEEAPSTVGTDEKTAAENQDDTVTSNSVEEATATGEKDNDSAADSSSSAAVDAANPVASVSSSGPKSDSFVVVSNKANGECVEVEEDEEDALGTANKAGDGYVWCRRLVFRAKLTMHTAFERSDNVDPAAVTALAISRDHRTIYVGDEKGRVFSWAISSKPGKGMVDHWCKDECSETCVGCGVKFTIYERRHHCRACGRLFCSSCSKYRSQIPSMKIVGHKVRVCKPCLDKIAKEEEAGSKKKNAPAAAAKT